MSITPKTAAAASNKQQTSTPAKVPQAPDLMSILNGEDLKKRLHSLLTEKSMLDRFIAVMTGAMKSTPRLAECTPASVVGALLKCAALKLEPNTPAGQCWLIPRKIKGVWECSWELGYKGAIDLGYRGGIKVIKAKAVHEMDTFDIDYGRTRNVVTHKPYLHGDRGQVIGYWAEWIDAEGNSDALFMSQYEMDLHVKHYVKSMDSEYSPWNTAYDKMALKTVIKQVLKFAPQSVDDLRNADSDDGSVILDGSTGELLSMRTSTRGAASTASLLTASPEEFTQTIEVTEKQGEPVPVSTPAPAPAQAAQDQAEIQRLDMVAKLKAKVEADSVDCVEIFGMPWGMIERQPITDLLRFYRMVSK
jgi:recombination protein RecT